MTVDQYDSADDYLSQDEVEYEEIDESDLLKYLDKLGNPLEICSKLFKENQPTSQLAVLKEEHVKIFEEKGFVVIDDFYQGDLSKVMNETRDRVAKGQLTPAHVPDESDPERDLNARSDLTMFLNFEKDESTIFNNVLQKFNDLVQDLNTIVKINKDHIELQLAYYPPNINAHYDRHRDAYPDDGEEQEDGCKLRRVTAICYLDPEYPDDNGGCLRIFHPDPLSENDTFVDVYPKAGRLVMFLSGAIDHAVLPVKKYPRTALTMWIH